MRADILHKEDFDSLVHDFVALFEGWMLHIRLRANERAESSTVHEIAIAYGAYGWQRRKSLM